MCFKTYLSHPMNKKNVAKKNNLWRSQFSKKRGGGPARYDHNHRLNAFVFCYPFPKLHWEIVLSLQYTTLYCKAQHSTALRCSVLNCCALDCTALHCTGLYVACKESVVLL